MAAAPDRSLRELQLSTLLANLPGMAYLCRNDAQWTMEVVSEGVLVLTGYAAEALLFNRDLSYEELIHPADREAVRAEVSAALAAARPFEMTYRIRRADGEEIWVWERGRGIVDERGEVSRLEGFITDVSERQAAEAAMRASEARWRALVANSPALVATIGRHGEVEWVNRTPSGRSGSEAIGRSIFDLLPEGEQERWWQALEAVWGEGRSDRFESRIVLADGRETWLEILLAPIQLEGRVTAAICIAIDISRRRENELHLRLGAAVFENAAEGILVTDAAGRIVSVNAGFERITGYAAAEAVGANPRLLRSGRHAPAFYAAMWSELAETGQWAGEVWNRRKSGEVYPEWLSIRGIRDARGALTHFVGIFSDITERKASEERIRFLAHHDPLTELPNRLLLADRLQQAARFSERAGRKAGLVLLDLDRFKAVNDQCGHAAGDLVLQEVARRLAGALREGDTAARFGGDEFVLVLPGLRASEDAGRIADKCLEAFASPFDAAGVTFELSASLGIAVFPDDGRESGELLGRADAAMYLAKQSGGGCFRFHGADLNLRALEVLSLESRLRQGIAAGELEARFAPRVTLAGAHSTGLVLRPSWRHPELGRLAASAFFPIAERRGLARPLAEWLVAAAAQAAVVVAAAAEAEACPACPVVLALPRPALEQADLRAALAASLTGLPLGAFELVAPVDLLGQDPALVSGLAELRSEGFRISVGELAFGPLPLDALVRLAPERLTLAADPVRRISSGAQAGAYLRALAGASRGLALPLAASGVERGELLASLAAAGVTEADGAAIGRSMTVAELPDWRRGERLLPG